MDALLEQLRLLIQARYPFIALISHEEERVLRLLRWLTSGHEEKLTLWTSTGGLESTGAEPSPDTTDPLKALEVVRLHEPRQLFVFRDFHPYLSDPLVVRKLRDLDPVLERDQKTLFFLCPGLSVPFELEKDLMVIPVSLPTAPEVARLLSTLVKAQNISLEPALYEKIVKASLGLTEKEIKKVYTRILLTGQPFDEAGLQTLLDEKRRILRRNRFLEYVEVSDNIDDVGGLNQLKEWLVQRGAAFTERARQFGLPQPKGVFLLGVQGCGKSLTAKVVARLWQLPLLRLDLASMVSVGAAGSEQNLHETILVAESMSPAILWIDEIEKAFGGVTGDGGDRGATTRVLGGLLTWLQEKSKPVFVIATANDVKHLPPELLRKGRFDEIFFIDLPTVHDRTDILAIHLRKRGRNPDDYQLYNVAEMTEKYSGAELEQLVVSGLFHAFSRDRELMTEDLQRQARDSVPLAVTMDQEIKHLKDWARYRTRPAAHDTRRLDFFDEWEAAEEDEEGELPI